MPVTPTYPGVYVEEIPSGVRTITGVATSITAFIGRAKRGPADKPVTINNNGDFERIFGGLWEHSTLGFAVRDFYLNGGSQAIIVRLYHPGEGDPPPVRVPLAVGGLSLEAAYPGAWAAELKASVETGAANVSADVAANLGLAVEDLFNLIVEDDGSGTREVYRNVSVKESARRIDKLLAGESKLVRWQDDFPDAPPAVNAAADVVPAVRKDLDDAQAQLDAAQEQLTAAQADLAAAQAADPPDPQAIADAEQAVTDATQAVADAEAPVAEAKDAIAAFDGEALEDDDFLPDQGEANKEGLYALEDADLFNLLCLPPYLATGEIDSGVRDAAIAYCEKRRAMLLVDPLAGWGDKDAAKAGVDALTRSKNAALFFPRLSQPNPLKDNQVESFAPCGAVAGVFARTDTRRGVWKAPAGLEARLVGVPDLAVALTDAENGELNPLAVNCLRHRPPAGRVVWGARTLDGDDRLASEWKYVPVRRLALFLEESLFRGTQWVVFEPNDEPLWAQIRLNVGAFMNRLFRQGAFQGTSPKNAYFVKCDHETTTQNDIDLGIVNIVVGFAPLKPAEFVILKIQQIAGQLET